MSLPVTSVCLFSHSNFYFYNIIAFSLTYILIFALLSVFVVCEKLNLNFFINKVLYFKLPFIR